MLKIGSRKPFGKQPVERFAAHEVPIFQPQHHEILYPIAADLAHTEVDAFHDWPGILEMSVHYRKPAHPMEREVMNDVAHDKGERVGVQACCAGKCLAATRARLRFVSIGNGWRDDTTNILRNRHGDTGR